MQLIYQFVFHYPLLMAVLFMAMVAMLTSIVHFAILTLARLPDFAGWDLVFAFRVAMVFGPPLLAYLAYAYARRRLRAVGTDVARTEEEAESRFQYVGVGDPDPAE